MLELNNKLTGSGQKTLKSNSLYIYPRVIEKLQFQRIGKDKMTPAQVADIAFSAIHNSKSRVLSTKKPNIKVLIKPKNGLANTAYVAEFGGSGSIKSIYPKELKKIKKDILGGRGVPPSGALQQNPAAPISVIQKSEATIPQSPNKVKQKTLLFRPHSRTSEKPKKS